MKPKLFKPSLKNQKRVASIIAKNLSKDKGIKISSGEIIPGTKKLK